MAVTIRITSVTAATCARRKVVRYPAVGICATSARAGIATLLLLTRLIRWTVGITYAFRSTGLIGIAKVIGKALTRANSIALTTDGVRSTRIWFAGCDLFIDYPFCSRERLLQIKRLEEKRVLAKTLIVVP